MFPAATLLLGLLAAGPTTTARTGSTAAARPRLSQPLLASSAKAVSDGGSERRPERPLQLTAAGLVLSQSMVALAPAIEFNARLGPAAATALLASIGSISAGIEIVISPIIGSLSDAIGRKPVLVATIAAACACKLVAAISPSVATIAASMFIGQLATGLFFLSSGAILGDTCAPPDTSPAISPAGWPTR